MSIFLRAIHWLLRVLRPRQHRLLANGVAVKRRHLSRLPDDLRERVEKLPARPRAVSSMVARAVMDFAHLREVLEGEESAWIGVDQVIVEEAESILRALVLRAPAVSALVSIASERDHDLPAREAAGESMLKLRDQVEALHQAASAAVQWAASHQEEDVRALKASVERLHLLTEAEREVNELLN